MNALAKLTLETIVALFVVSVAVATEKAVFDVVDRTTRVALANDKPIALSLKLSDGDIDVEGEDIDEVRLVVSDLDGDMDEGDSGTIIYDPIDATVTISLRGELLESDIRIAVPRSAFVSLRTYDGDVVVSGSRGGVEASSEDGNVVLRDVSGGIVANSKDGDMRIELNDGAIEQPVSVATIDGDIFLSAPKELKAEVVAMTVDGGFDCDFSIALRSRNGSPGMRMRGDGVQVQGEIGGGGPRVSLKTIDGNIVIAERIRVSR